MTNEEAINYLQQLYPYGGHCWLDEQRTEAIGMAIEALTEKSKLSSIERNGKDCKDDPLSEDLEHAVTDYLISIRLGDHNLTKAFKAGAYWQKQKDDEMLTVVYMDGVEKGKKMTRQQMMEDAEVSSITHKTSNIYEEIIITNGSRYAHDSVRYTSD